MNHCFVSYPIEFYSNEDLSSRYRMTLDKQDEASLFAFYNAADANLDVDVDDDGSDTEFPCTHDESLDEFPTEFMSLKKPSFARCDSVGTSAMDLLHLDDRAKSFSYSVGASAMDLLHLDDKAKSFCQSPNFDRRRSKKLRKYARMSLSVNRVRKGRGNRDE